MNKFCLLLLAFISFQIKAQYTITSASNPSPGDVESYLDIDSTGLFHGSSGTSQTWNYSFVTPNGNPLVTNTYVPVSSIPNNTMFPSATIGIDLGGSGGYGVVSNTGSKFEYLGYAEATFTNCWAYSDPYKVYSLPFSYGSVSTDTYVLFQPTNITRGTFTTTGDGTGTLQLPTVTIPNALKLSYTIFETDTTSTSTVMNFTINLTQYYASVSKFILLEVQTFTMSTITGTNVSASYYKTGRIHSIYAPLGIKKIVNKEDLIIYPNPVTNGELFISGIPSSEKTTAQIYDISGRTVKTVLLESGSEPKKIHVSDLSKGIYYLKVESREMIKTQKIIIE